MPTNIDTMPPVTRGTICVPPKNTPGSNLESFGSRKKNKLGHPPPSDTTDNNLITCDKSNKRNKKNESNKEKQCNNAANKQSQVRSVSPTPHNTNTLPDDNLLLVIKKSSHLPHVDNDCYEITSPIISGKDDIAVAKHYATITTHSMGVLDNMMSKLGINRMDAIVHLLGAATSNSCRNNTKSALDDKNAGYKSLAAEILTLMTYRLDKINNKQEGNEVDVDLLLDMMKDLHMKERNAEDDISSSDNDMDTEEDDSSSSILSRPSTSDPITDNNNNDSQEDVSSEASTEEVGADETAGNNDSFDMELIESNSDTNTRVEGSSVASGEMTDADDEGISIR